MAAAAAEDRLAAVSGERRGRIDAPGMPVRPTVPSWAPAFERPRPHPRPPAPADDEPPGLDEPSSDDEPSALEPGPAVQAAVRPPAAARPASAGSKEPELSGITPEMAKRMLQGGAASGKAAKAAGKAAAGLGGSSRERGSPSPQPSPQRRSALPANGHGTGTGTEGMPPLEEETSEEGLLWVAVVGTGIEVPFWPVGYVLPAMHVRPRLVFGYLLA